MVQGSEAHSAQSQDFVLCSSLRFLYGRGQRIEDGWGSGAEHTGVLSALPVTVPKAAENGDILK